MSLNGKKVRRLERTDEYYTPSAVYDVVRDYVLARYFPDGGFDPARIVRPFYPGGDYAAADYPPGCIVLDNPPFSCVTQIVRAYDARGIKFFLFCSSLGLLNVARKLLTVTRIMTNAHIRYTCGMKVNTSFCTNLPDPVLGMPYVRTDPELRAALKRASNTRTVRTQPVPERTFPTRRIGEKELFAACVRGVEAVIYPQDVERAVGHEDGSYSGVLYCKDGSPPLILRGGVVAQEEGKRA